MEGLNRQTIGILGGMAPSASNYMYDMLIKLSIQRFGAANNNDFPEIILYSIPVPDFISNNKKKVVARNMLIDRVKSLSKLNVSCISIACNTAHLLLDDLQKVSSAPFISMIDEVVNVIKKEGLKTVGVLGSPVTIRSKLYQEKLKSSNIEVKIPDNIKIMEVEKVIRNVIKGKSTNNDFKILSRITEDLVARGAEGILLGCTELPIIFPLQYKIPVYNSVEILCMALLRRYYESNTIDTI
jgi:aspartate racemase